MTDQAKPDPATGLAAFLEHEWGTAVKIQGLAASSAGARRANIAFDAEPERGPTRNLVATIMPTAAIQLNSVGAEVGVRVLTREYGVPVPEVVAWSEDAAWVGGPFFLSQRVEGETVPRQVLRLVEAEGIGELVVRQIGDAMARLHAIDPALAPDDLLHVDDGDPAEQGLAGLTAIASLLLEPRPALSLGLKWLERHLPPTRPGHTNGALVHTDIRNGNLIIGPDGLRAILDWEGTRARGDPMEDVAWLALRMWRFRNDDREIGGFAALGPLTEAYEAAGGTFDTERYRWWKVYGTLKWALGLAAQARGHIDGSFRSIVMAASGRRVPELEWDLLMLIRPDGPKE